MPYLTSHCTEAAYGYSFINIVRSGGSVNSAVGQLLLKANNNFLLREKSNCCSLSNKFCVSLWE